MPLIVALMDQLFAIDAQARAQKLTQSDRHLLREQKARPLLERIRQTNVRREKGRAIQWEEDIPPGNCCSSRKQSERSGLVTVQHGASDAEGPARPDQRALRP